MPQMTSTIDYKALAKRVAQRAIYADNNADPNNKAWAADLRAVVSLLNGMADAQPVAWRCEVRDLLTQAEQCLSTAVQFAQWAHDEPPSYLSAWDYEADHIAAEIRAMLAAAPAVPQADAQPVAAVPVDWMERLKEAVKHIGYANVEKWYRLGGEDMIEQAKSDAVTAYATLCEALESLYAAPAAPQAEPKRDWSAIDAAIREYLDGYEQIGENDAGADACYTPTERELYLIYDAINGLFADESFVAAISASQAGPKREPLSDEQMTRAAQDVLAERRRQIEAEGWTPEHDDQHGNWELSRAAVCYGDMGGNGPFSYPHTVHPPRGWPWHWTWWKPSDDPRRNLVKAGALILAEIERLDRMGGSDAE